MADLKDLDYTSILDMSNDDAIEALRQIRLSRRNVVRTQSKSTVKTQKTSESIDPNMAARLLEILGGSNNNE